MFKLYTQEFCPRCDELKGFLKEQGIAYEEVDPTNDFTARAFMSLHDLEELPVVRVGNEALAGELDDMKAKIVSML